MRKLLFLAALLLALGALLYLPGTVLWSWPGQAWALAGFIPLCAYVGFASLESTAAAHAHDADTDVQRDRFDVVFCRYALTSSSRVAGAASLPTQTDAFAPATPSCRQRRGR